MKSMNEIQQALNKEVSRAWLKNQLGDLALSHHDYLYNIGSPHVISPDKDTYTEFLTKMLAELESATLLFSELLELDQLVRKNDLEKYLNFSDVPATMGFYEACTILKEWRQTTPANKYKSSLRLKSEAKKMLSAFAKFDLPSLSAKNKYVLPTNTNNPLIIAITQGKMQVADALLRAGASSNVAMIQSAIDANNLELLQLLVNHSSSLIPNEFIPLLRFNLEKQKTALTAEMVRALKVPCKGLPASANNSYWLLFNIAADCVTRLNSSLIQELLFTHIPSHDIPALLTYAVKNESTELAVAILSHPDFPAKSIEMDFVRAMSPDAQGSVHKGVAGLIFQKQFECFVDKRYFKIYVYSSTPSEHDIDRNARYRGLTQESVAAYLLARNQNLPQNPQSIALIRADLAEIKNPETILHIFLRGTVIGRLRNKLVADLEGELAKREKAIVASVNEGTSSRVTYQAPVASSSASALVSEDIELTDLNPERPKVNT
jgi:hypothetical protein